MIKRILLTALVWLAVGLVGAQDDGGATDTAETSVNYFFIACEDLAVIDLNGFATPGFDIFYQVFNQAGGNGEALTSLRRANVDGEYAYSERIAYRDGQRVAPGAIASARVLIARTESPDAPAFETVVDDIQDGCNDAQNPLQSSDDAGDPFSGQDTNPDVDGIANPEGGTLNPVVVFTPEPEVLIGPRQGPRNPERTANPGLLFALCDSFYPEAQPGLIYDSDNVRVFWYWYAETPERLQENLSQTNYNVTINSAPVHTINVSSVQERNGVYYTFFTVPVGNLRPGWYEVAFQQTWNQAITDGFGDYGPGTGVSEIKTNCNFKVEPNPTGAGVVYSGMYIGADTPSHNFEQAIIQQQVIQTYLEERSNVGQRGDAPSTNPTATPAPAN
jgi:hypothetical protein